MRVRIFLISLVLGTMTNCGVKGQPQVPDYSPFIGKGIREQAEDVPASTPASSATPLPTATPSPALIGKPENKK